MGCRLPPPFCFPSSLPHPPCFFLDFLKTFDPENVSDLGLEKLKLINCLFEGVESDKKSEGMPGLTDPKPPRYLDGLKDECVISLLGARNQRSGYP